MTDTTTATPDVKPGIKTTEFWITKAIVILGVLLAAGVFGSGQTAQIVGAILAGAAQLGYTAARAYVKGAAAQASS